MNAEACASIWLAIIFSILLGSLIFNTKFRADLMGKDMPGKVTFLGMTVEGGFLLIVLVALIATFVHTVGEAQRAYAANDKTMATAIALDRLPYEPKPSSVESALAAIERDHNKATKEIDVVAAVRSLTYEGGNSATIRGFPAEHIGPWRIDATAKKTKMSVPKSLTKGEISACPGYVNARIEVRSDMESASPYTGTPLQYISRSDDCEVKFPFIQVSCDIAVIVLSEDTLTCDQKNNPLWKHPSKDNLYTVYVTRVDV